MSRSAWSCDSFLIGLFFLLPEFELRLSCLHPESFLIYWADCGKKCLRPARKHRSLLQPREDKLNDADDMPSSPFKCSRVIPGRSPFSAGMPKLPFRVAATFFVFISRKCSTMPSRDTPTPNVHDTVCICHDRYHVALGSCSNVLSSTRFMGSSPDTTDTRCSTRIRTLPRPHPSSPSNVMSPRAALAKLYSHPHPYFAWLPLA